MTRLKCDDRRMGFYAKYILPWGIDMACSMAIITAKRQLVVPQAEGIVLELGIGSGHNLPHYDPEKIKKVIGIDPDAAIWKRSAQRRAAVGFPVERIGLSGEEIPLDNNSVDNVLVTYSLCTIPDPVAALREARRVMRPGGRLIFLEHGEAPEENIRKWQSRIDPVWKRLAGGCHTGRPIPKIIEEAGWTLENLNQGYIKGPKPLAFNYWGTARE